MCHHQNYLSLDLAKFWSIKVNFHFLSLWPAFPYLQHNLVVAETKHWQLKSWFANWPKPYNKFRRKLCPNACCRNLLFSLIKGPRISKMFDCFFLLTFHITVRFTQRFPSIKPTQFPDNQNLPREQSIYFRTRPFQNNKAILCRTYAVNQNPDPHNFYIVFLTYDTAIMRARLLNTKKRGNICHWNCRTLVHSVGHLGI